MRTAVRTLTAAARALGAVAVATVALATLAVANIAVADAGGARVTDAWVRVTPAGDVAAAYLTLHNDSSRPLAVTGVRSALAAHAMIHESALIGGQSRMRARGELVVPPGGTVRFAPGGLHLMLTGLVRPLHAGDPVSFELLFGDGASLRVSAIARSAAAPPHR